ncbi:hypothetical protein SDC9_188472 [bioreactor metagenome]|uniref:Uncharacterized protein n=1 Tax=bioreactor metagenome TaxID=1076179 RepID=A0A645HR56_9ZZZZ
MLRAHRYGNGQRAGKAAGEEYVFAQQQDIIRVIKILADRRAAHVVAKRHLADRERGVIADHAGYGYARRAVGKRAQRIARFNHRRGGQIQRTFHRRAAACRNGAGIGTRRGLRPRNRRAFR